MFRLLLLALVLAVPASEALQCYQCESVLVDNKLLDQLLIVKRNTACEKNTFNRTATKLISCPSSQGYKCGFVSGQIKSEIALGKY